MLSDLAMLSATARAALLVLVSAAPLLTPSLADAQTPWSQRSAFERDFALSIYGTATGGDYTSLGGGVRARWEPFDRLGVEAYTEHLWVNVEDGARHDHPVGFNLYSPFRLTPWLRFRPLFGFCAVFSFYDPERQGVDGTQDIHFGVHGGGGLELALGRFVSLFADVQGVLYFGHEGYVGGWAAHVGDELAVWGVVQSNLGLSVHL